MRQRQGRGNKGRTKISGEKGPSQIPSSHLPGRCFVICCAIAIFVLTKEKKQNGGDRQNQCSNSDCRARFAFLIRSSTPTWVSLGFSCWQRDHATDVSNAADPSILVAGTVYASCQHHSTPVPYRSSAPGFSTDHQHVSAITYAADIPVLAGRRANVEEGIGHTGPSDHFPAGRPWPLVGQGRDWAPHQLARTGTQSVAVGDEILVGSLHPVLLAVVRVGRRPGWPPLGHGYALLLVCVESLPPSCELSTPCGSL